MRKFLAGLAPSRSQWCKVAGCILVVWYGHLEGFAVPQGMSAARRAGVVGHVEAHGNADADAPMLASLGDTGVLLEQDIESVHDSDESEQCWQTPNGRVCRDASFCSDGSCSGPGPNYTPPIAQRYRADVSLPAGYVLRDAWLEIDDATDNRSARRLIDGYQKAATVRTESPREGVTRLVFDVAMFRPGQNAFKVRGEAVRGDSVRRFETPQKRMNYSVPETLGHIAPGTFRLPLLDFPRTMAQCSAGLCKDRDGDGLNDLWENVAARQLRPRLMMDSADGLFQSTTDTVRILTSVVPIERNGESYVLFASVFAFSVDYGVLGFFGHPGDTEVGAMLFRVDAHETLHWVTSATKGHPCVLCRPTYRFGKQQFARDGVPLMFVEKNKHGIWENGRSCRRLSGFRCRGDRSVRPEAVNIGDAGPDLRSTLIDSLDHVSPGGPFGALAGVFPGDAVWSPERARIPGRFCGGQPGCSDRNSATQPGSVLGRMVDLVRNSAW